jgi:hypothetical protein
MTRTAWPLRRLASGLVLVALAWALSWQQVGPPVAGASYFFFLWLGYVLTVDSLVERRSGSSPLGRGRAGWLALFVLSAPAWWLFEYLNGFLHNWEYLGAESFGPLTYAALATLCFSTVLPAVFTTAELLYALVGKNRLTGRRALSVTPRALSIWIGCGLLLLGGVVAAPRWFFPAAWLAVFLVLDPLNHLAGRPSVMARFGQGDYRLAAVLALGAFVCGLFWEMWNFHASPKWIYHVPFVGSPKVFEMPVLGYLGYLPFGLELYALYHFLMGLLRPGAWPLRLDDV